MTLKVGTSYCGYTVQDRAKVAIDH